MRISHEVPISLLKESRKFNDYSYCLVHLLDEYPEYKDFYKEEIKLGRSVLLDNSLFELETLFDGDIFAQKIVEMKPTEYIIPDSLEDINETINSFNNFISAYDVPGIKIGVVQGKTLDEVIECYKFMSDKADKIAISFDYSLYNNLINSDDKLVNWCEGRKWLVHYLYDNNIWNTKKPHHLLGCSLAREFLDPLYNKLVDSVDTSNPIVTAIKGLKYNDIEGLAEKPSIKLMNLITHKLSDDQKELLDYNVSSFRKICNQG